MAKSRFKHGEKRVAKLNGEQWDFVAVRPSTLTKYRKGKEPEQSDGDCVVPAHPKAKLSRKDRRIRFDLTMDDRDLMETLIHEATHGQRPELNEAWVTLLAEELTEVLCMYGFVRKGHDAD